MSRAPNRRSRAARLAGAAAGLIAVAAGCGVPQDKEPQKIAQPLPAALVEPASTSTTIPERTSPQILFLLRSQGGGSDAPDALVPIVVQVKDPENPADLPRAVLEQLVKAPTAEERERDLRSAIPDGTAIGGVTRDGGTVTVDLNNLGTVESQRQRLAAAQIVFTLTQLPGVESVRFLNKGQPATVPLDEGNSDQGQAVSRADYPKLLAALTEGPTTTTTAAPS